MRCGSEKKKTHVATCWPEVGTALTANVFATPHPLCHTEVSKATSQLGSLHSQCSCGAKMLRIIISMASAI